MPLHIVHELAILIESAMEPFFSSSLMEMVVDVSW